MSDFTTPVPLSVPNQSIRNALSHGHDGLAPSLKPSTYSEPALAHNGHVRDVASEDIQVNGWNTGSPAMQRPPASRHGVPRLDVYSHAVSECIKSIGHWLHFVWLDVAMIILGLLVALILRKYTHIFHYNERGFLVAKNAQGYWEAPMAISWPRYMSPAHISQVGSTQRRGLPDFILGIVLIGVSVSGGAVAIILLMQLFVRDLWDKVSATMGMLKALVTV